VSSEKKDNYDCVGARDSTGRVVLLLLASVFVPIVKPKNNEENVKGLNLTPQ